MRSTTKMKLSPARMGWPRNRNIPALLFLALVFCGFGCTTMMEREPGSTLRPTTLFPATVLNTTMLGDVCGALAGQEGSDDVVLAALLMPAALAG